MASPDCASFLPVDFDLSELKSLEADVMALYVVDGPKDSSEARPDAKDLWWRVLLKCTGEAIAAACFHVHADSIDINGRVGELGSGTFPIGRCTLRNGFKIAKILGPEGFKMFTFDFWAPGAKASREMTVVLCARDKIAETQYFKAKNWREEKCDGAERNLFYVTIPLAYEVTSWAEDKMKGPVENMLLYALTKADPAKHAEGMVVCEYSRLLYDADGKHTQMLFGMAASSGFGTLPGQGKVFTGGVVTEDGKLKPATAVCDVSCAVMGPRHRCFRTGVPLLTAEHEGSAACAAKHNDAGKNKWAPRRGAAGGGAKEKRREQRAGAGAPPMPAQLLMAGAPPLPMMPPAGLLQRGDHEREGHVRNGQGKRPAEGEGSQQGPPALRDESM